MINSKGYQMYTTKVAVDEERFSLVIISLGLFRYRELVLKSCKDHFSSFQEP